MKLILRRVTQNCKSVPSTTSGDSSSSAPPDTCGKITQQPTRPVELHLPRAEKGKAKWKQHLKSMLERLAVSSTQMEASLEDEIEQHNMNMSSRCCQCSQFLKNDYCTQIQRTICNTSTNQSDYNCSFYFPCSFNDLDHMDYSVNGVFSRRLMKR